MKRLIVVRQHRTLACSHRNRDRLSGSRRGKALCSSVKTRCGLTGVAEAMARADSVPFHVRRHLRRPDARPTGGAGPRRNHQPSALPWSFSARWRSDEDSSAGRAGSVGKSWSTRGHRLTSRRSPSIAVGKRDHSRLVPSEKLAQRIARVLLQAPAQGAVFPFLQRHGACALQQLLEERIEFPCHAVVQNAQRQLVVRIE